jgi:hypothetical protein
LYERLEQLSVKYQSERNKLNNADIVPLVIRALCQCLNCDLVTLCDPCDVTKVSINDAKTLVLTSEISKAAKAIMTEDELDLELHLLEVRPIGSLMRKLRFEHGNQGGTHRNGWYVGKQELARLALAYGLANRDHHSENDSHYSNVTKVTDGHNVTPGAIQINEERSIASIPFMITADMRRRLREYGETDEEIDGMKPKEAHALLQYFENYAGVA